MEKADISVGMLKCLFLKTGSMSGYVASIRLICLEADRPAERLNRSSVWKYGGESEKARLR
jgi:hypothetical protein